MRFIICAVSIFIGMIIGVSLPIDAPSPPPFKPKPLPVIAGRVPAYPSTMTIRLLSPQDFARETSVKQLQATQGIEVAAFTVLKNPCTITIPSDFEINVVAPIGEAWFSTREISNIIAHEMLHCLYGAWHLPWNLIPSKSSRVWLGVKDSPR